jgi:DNA-binding MarR family transcriptional regulator
MAAKAKRPPADSTRARKQVLPLVEHLARVSRRAYENAMTPDGWLRPRHLIALKMLDDNGPQSQHSMIDALSLDPSNVVGLLNELEERGLVSRRRDPADRRGNIVELSRLGVKELGAAYDRVSLVEDDVLSALSADERATLYRLLQQALGGESPSYAADNPLAASQLSRPAGSPGRALGLPSACRRFGCAETRSRGTRPPRSRPL